MGRRGEGRGGRGERRGGKKREGEGGGRGGEGRGGRGRGGEGRRGGGRERRGKDRGGVEENGRERGKRRAGVSHLVHFCKTKKISSAILEVRPSGLQVSMLTAFMEEGRNHASFDDAQQKPVEENQTGAEGLKKNDSVYISDK